MGLGVDKMRIVKGLILLGLVLLLSGSGCTNKSTSNTTLLDMVEQNQTIADSLELTKEEMVEDFDYLYKIIEDNHPYLEVTKRKYGYDWLSKKELHRKWIEGSKDTDEFIRRIGEIVRKLRNRHTSLFYLMPEYEVYGDGNDPWSMVFKNDNT